MLKFNGRRKTPIKAKINSNMATIRPAKRSRIFSSDHADSVTGSRFGAISPFQNNFHRGKHTPVDLVSGLSTSKYHHIITVIP